MVAGMVADMEVDMVADMEVVMMEDMVATEFFLSQTFLSRSFYPSFRIF